MDGGGTPTSLSASSSAAPQQMQLQDALRMWQEINLSSLQRQLDEQSVDILSNQRESLASRKQLADQTKDLKKVPDADKLEFMKGLLKGYQGEIDRLTKRSKFAETAFLAVYKQLAEAPDPATLVGLAAVDADRLSHIDVMVAENKQLRAELEDASRQYVELKHQAGGSQRLRERLQEMEGKLDALVREQVDERELVLRKDFEGKLRASKEREFVLERQLVRAQDEAASLRTTHDSAQAHIFDYSRRFDETVSAKLAELEIVANDLQRAQEQVSLLGREKELLAAQLHAKSAEPSTPPSSAASLARLEASYEQQLRLKDAQLARVSEALQRLQATTSGVHHAELAQLTAQLNERHAEVLALQERLHEMSDYDDVVQELAVLKQIEFSGEQAAASGQTSTVETLLALKNRRLTAEVAQYRVTVSESEANLAAALEREGGLRREVDEQKAVIARLEADVAAVRTAPNAEPENHSGKSILPIVTGQRDRFQKRVGELEAALARSQQAGAELQGRLQASQDDNVKMYEKIRYLQSYTRAENTSVSVSDEVATRYKPMYEDRLNPFNEFHEKERRQRFGNLDPTDRATLTMFRYFLSSKYMRLFFLGYTLFLHLLVLALMFSIASREACVHDHDVVLAAGANVPVGAVNKLG